MLDYGVSGLKQWGFEAWFPSTRNNPQTPGGSMVITDPESRNTNQTGETPHR
jgi:hypothetical protein